MVYNNYICNNGEKYKEKKSFSVLKVEYVIEPSKITVLISGYIKKDINKY